MDDSRYYRPSGTAPVGGILTTLAISVPVAFVIGAVYGAIAWYNPFIYINFLGILVTGGACGFVVRKGLLLGRIRSRSVANSTALFVSCVSLYASWLTYFMAIEGEVFFAGPFAVWSGVVRIGALGVWEIFGTTPSGWVLYLIWLTEAAGLVGFAMLVAVGEETPYCEYCQEWTKEVISKIPLPYRGIDEFRAALEAEKYGGLLKKIGQPVSPALHFAFTVNCCPNCSESNFLAIHEMKHKEDSEDLDETLQIGWLIVDGSVVERIEKRIKKAGRDAIIDSLHEGVGDS